MIDDELNKEEQQQDNNHDEALNHDDELHPENNSSSQSNESQASPNQSNGKIRRSLFRKTINFFILSFISLLALVLVLIGFTQTKTFRNFLRDKVVELVNKEINGKLNIERIDGTIITSLFLKNTSIVVDKDTLLFAKEIEVKTSPVQLLVKKIFIRKFSLKDISINLLQDESGKWNYEKLIKPKPEDTSKTTFSFLIQAPDIELRNLSLTRKTFSNKGSEKIYQNLNADDLRIDNLFFNAQAFADIENNNYLLILKELSFKPNLTRFNLRYISGEFAITQDFASVNNFYFLTDSSEVKINARIDSLNLFSNTPLRNFRDYPLSIDLKASPFNFDDLSSFITSTEILKGNPSFELKAKGKFGAFNIERAKLDYRNTHFDFSGQILNLNVPNKLFIKANISNTDIDYKDINYLLPSLKLPDYAKMVLTNVNVEYEGEPTNFKTKFAGNVDDGKIEGEGSMDLKSKPIKYDIKFSSSNLNLAALTNFPTSINADFSIVGKGTSPMDLFADMKLKLQNTLINDITIDKLDVEGNAKDRRIDLTFIGNSEGAKSYISSYLVYDQDTIPSYNIIGDVKNLDLEKFTKEPNLKSKLNLYFSLDGSSFDLDKMNTKFSFGIDSSYIKNKWINSSIVEARLSKSEDKREISLTSDFVDFKVDGNFSLSKALELLAYESKSISQIISNKITELNPLNVIEQKQVLDTTKIEQPKFINEDLKFNYNFKFKDFELIALLIGNDKLDIAGSGSGYVENTNPNFTISTELNIEYLVMMNQGKMIYLSNFNSGFNFSRDNNSSSFDNIFGSASVTGKRFYSGSNIKSIHADLVFNQSKLFLNAGANFDDLFSLEGEGLILMTPNEQKFLLTDLLFNYDGIEWTNADTVKAHFNQNLFSIEQCELRNDTTKIYANGIIQNDGEQNLNITAKSITGKILEKYFFGIKNSTLITNGTAKAKITGKFENPLIDVSFEANDLKIEKYLLGNIKGSMNYVDKKMTTKFTYLDANRNEANPLFLFKGEFPIDLSFASVKERFLSDEPLSIELYSENFNLRQLGNVLPFISDQSGNLKANIKVKGSFNNPEFEGYAYLTNGFFKTTSTNLDYKVGAKLNFDRKGIKVDSLSLANAGGTNYPGEIKGIGSIVFDGFEMKDVNLRFFGSLAVMSQQTKNVSPFFYGDLKISTDGDWLLTKQADKFYFKANMIMDKTDLYYTTGRDEAASTNKNFDFVFVVDSSKIDKELIRFQNILSLENSNSSNKKYNNRNFNFDYEIGIKSGNDAKLTFILGQALNQKLFVNMNGSMKYENINNISRAQGTFELLQGSKLDFFKTFDAVGFLRFEGDITNPFLDITATYNSTYINPRDEKQELQDVAIKINIKGPLSDLGKNLSSDQNALSVYIGARNIQNNVRDTKYDYADAFSFILMGKFKDDLTAQDKAVVAGQTKNAIGSTATSFLGSVLTNFVNSQVGDLINNITINSSGEQTKFSLSGRIENFSYSFGGTTETFSNFSKANLMLEYRFYPTNLKARFERKDPIIKTFGLDDKILEMALKYKFEF